MAHLAQDPEADELPDAAEPDEDAADAEAERREMTVDVAGHGQRLDKLLVALAPEFSRSHLQHLVEQGAVRVDGQPSTVPSRKLRSGQRVVVELRPTPQSQAFRPEALPIDVVFEDEHLMVVHKPVGCVVHPAAGHWSGTLLNALLAHHGRAAELPRAGIVHRLDKDTSGLMVVGKTLEAVTALTRAIAARSVHREYLALVHGEVLQPALLAQIEAPIARDPRSRVRMAVVPGGKPARTDVEVVATRNGYTAVRCILHTGRTHQIRVHLSSRGYPLVADSLYGGRDALGLHRQALHAWRLRLPHPVDGRPLQFEVPAPADFSQAWQTVVS
ncbi:RluA family pseudouridine synthase [Caldimonas caldifontis]